MYLFCNLVAVDDDDDDADADSSLACSCVWEAMVV